MSKLDNLIYKTTEEVVEDQPIKEEWENENDIDILNDMFRTDKEEQKAAAIVEDFDTGLIESEDTVRQLTALVEQSVKKQLITQPKLLNLQDKLLEILAKPEEIYNMDHAIMIKIIEVTHRLSTQPLDQLTKLVQTITQLEEVREFNKSKDAMDDMVDRLKNLEQEVRHQQGVVFEVNEVDEQEEEEE
jgi:cell fate (sporulation/competence/biofilm development) regulator YmcA (YheA/YmcA/DUF963 family)